MNIKYIDKHSNHPHVIKKYIPKMPQKRVSALSKNLKIFDDLVANYQKALRNFKYVLK